MRLANQQHAHPPPRSCGLWICMSAYLSHRSTGTRPASNRCSRTTWRRQRSSRLHHQQEEEPSHGRRQHAPAPIRCYGRSVSE